MGIISSNRKKHIQGHKALTTMNESEYLKLTKAEVEFIYIPLVASNGKPLTNLVKEGDAVKKGTIVALRDDGLYVPSFSSVSGEVVQIEDYYHPASGRKVKHLVIRNDFNYVEDLLKERVTKSASREKIVELIKNAGIVGLGGAGFPTYVKYQSANNIHTILINGVECEPYLTTDYIMGQVRVELMLEGIQLLMKAAGASKAIIAVKKGKLPLIAKIREFLAKYPGVELVLVPDAYPMGWERILVKQVFKKEYVKFPSEIGVIVNNSQTAIAVAEALLNGKPITERVVTFSGHGLKVCANVLTPIGVPVNKIIAFLNGYNFESVYLLPGGPMTSKAAISDEFAITPTMGGITVLEAKSVESEACLRCGQCIDYCPAGIMPVEIMNAQKVAEKSKNKDVARLKDLLTDTCVECGMCSYICPSSIELTEFVKKAKNAIRIADAVAARAKK